MQTREAMKPLLRRSIVTVQERARAALLDEVELARERLHVDRHKTTTDTLSATSLSPFLSADPGSALLCEVHTRGGAAACRLDSRMANARISTFHRPDFGAGFAALDRASAVGRMPRTAGTSV